MDRFQARAVAEHIVRDTGNTKSDLRKVDQKIVAVQFHLRQQLQSLGRKHLMKVFTGSAFRSKHQDGIIQKVFQGKRRFSHGKIIRVCYEDITEFQHSLKFCVGRKPGVGVIGDDQFCLAVFQKLRTSDGSDVDDLDPHFRVILVEPAEIRDEEIAAQSIAGTDPQLTGKISLAGKGCLAFVKHGKGRFYVLEKKLSLRSQDHPFGASNEQGVAQFFLQVFDRPADCRLGDKKLSGSLRKT